MPPKDFSDLRLEDLSLEPIDGQALPATPAAGKAKFTTDARKRGERRKGGDRRQEVRLQKDRRSGKDRRPRKGWEGGKNI